MILILNQSYISRVSKLFSVCREKWMIMLCHYHLGFGKASDKSLTNHISFIKETLYVLKYVCMYVRPNVCTYVLQWFIFFHRSKVWLLIHTVQVFQYSHAYVFKEISHFGPFDLKSYICTTYLVNDKSTGRFCGLFKNP